MKNNNDFVSNPIANYNPITNRELIKYHKNLDVETLESYFSKKYDSIHIKFPVEKKVVIEGIHYYNYFFGDFLIIHISNDGSLIRTAEKIQILSLEILKVNLSTIQGKFDLSKQEKIHVFIYNDNGVFPKFEDDTFDFEKGIKRPNEAGGGGVIIVGP